MASDAFPDLGRLANDRDSRDSSLHHRLDHAEAAELPLRLRRDELTAKAVDVREARSRRARTMVSEAIAEHFQRPTSSASSSCARPIPMWQQPPNPQESLQSDIREVVKGYSGPVPAAQVSSSAVPAPFKEAVRMPRSMKIQPLLDAGSRGVEMSSSASTPSGAHLLERHRQLLQQPQQRPSQITRNPSEYPASLQSALGFPEKLPGCFSSRVEEPAASEVNLSDAARKKQEAVRKLLLREVKLEELPEELRGKEEVVLAALQVDGLALQHASTELQGDRAIVLTALSENGLALSHASAVVRQDKEILTAAVRQAGGAALQFASEGLRSDQELTLEALAADPDAVRFVARNLLDNKEFVLAAAPLSRRVFEKASFRLKRDRQLVLQMVTLDPEAFLFAAWELRCDRDFVLAAVSLRGCAIAHASPALQRDPAVLSAAICNDPSAAAAVL
ncbi:unnamed protein product [Polarella glacialis]|uniref:DUF4116 domain-containing protein n=1 Tax=Polarella glacialis TaxID=89957 RepID=A0A813FED8_POLGL|nr:unnamed protein product [Polarella glacialis]